MTTNPEGEDPETTRPLPAPTAGRAGDEHMGGAWRSLSAMPGRVRRDSLVRNSLFIMSTTVVNALFGYAFWLLAARMFPVEVVGVAAGLIAVGTILVLLASLGVGGTLIQSLPATGRSAAWSLTFWAGMAVALGVGVTIVLGSLVLLPLVAEEFAVLRGAGYGSLFAVGTLAMIAGFVIDYAFLAERAAGTMLVRNSVVAVGKVLLVLVLFLEQVRMRSHCLAPGP